MRYQRGQAVSMEMLQNVVKKTTIKGCFDALRRNKEAIKHEIVRD